MRQRQLAGPGPLLKKDGSLADVGWARQPLLDCNLEDASFYALRLLQPLRVKRWDYYGLTTPTHFYSFTLSDLGYLQMVFAYMVDFAARTHHEETLTLPPGAGVRLPRNSTEGESRFDNGRVRLAFLVEPEARRLEVEWPGFRGGESRFTPPMPLSAPLREGSERGEGRLRPAPPLGEVRSASPLGGLRASIRLALPAAQESLVIVTPMAGKRFYYNRKINCLPAEGWLEDGGVRVALDPASCLGNLDWGRGVWPYRSFWVWTTASGFLPDRRRVGLNLGFGFGDTSAATENALLLEGRVHKLGQVDYIYDRNHLTAPWSLRSPDGRLTLRFDPFYDRVAKTDFKLLGSEVHQLFGRFNGTAQTDEGETIEIRDLVGSSEEHHARW